MGGGLWLVTVPLRASPSENEDSAQPGADIKAYELTGAVLRQTGPYVTEITSAGGAVSHVHMTIEQILESIGVRDVPSTDHPS